MDLSVFFVGTSGSLPTPRRGLPAIVVRRGSDRILFDCGEGTQRQLLCSIGLLDFTEVFLTHFHADHWLGLPGLLKTLDLRGRYVPLAIHGPRGLDDLLTLVMRTAGRVSYELHRIELEPGAVLERDGYRIATVPVSHRGPALGYVLQEDDRPGVFDPQRAAELGVSPGPDFGRLQRGQSVGGVRPEQVMGPPRDGRKLTISGDTRPCEALKAAAYRSDLLVHESTFAIEDAERAFETGHATASQAAGVARDADVKLLALTHFSTRYPVSQLRDEAREIFRDTVAPRDFDMVEIPFAEKGRPRLVRWPGSVEPDAEHAALEDGAPAHVEPDGARESDRGREPEDVATRPT